MDGKRGRREIGGVEDGGRGGGRDLEGGRGGEGGDLEGGGGGGGDGSKGEIEGVEGARTAGRDLEEERDSQEGTDVEEGRVMSVHILKK